MYGGFLLGPLAKSRLLIGENELLTWPFPEDRTPLLSAMISVVGVIFNYFAKNIHFQFWAKSPLCAFFSPCGGFFREIPTTQSRDVPFFFLS